MVPGEARVAISRYLERYRKTPQHQDRLRRRPYRRQTEWIKQEQEREKKIKRSRTNRWLMGEPATEENHITSTRSWLTQTERERVGQHILNTGACRCGLGTQENEIADLGGGKSCPPTDIAEFGGGQKLPALRSSVAADISCQRVSVHPQTLAHSHRKATAEKLRLGGCRRLSIADSVAAVMNRSRSHTAKRRQTLGRGGGSVGCLVP